MRKLLNKKALSAFLAIVMTFATMAGMFAVPASATTIEWTASEITLANEDDLKQFIAELQTGRTFAGQTIKLGKDMDLNPDWDASTKVAPSNGYTWPAITTSFNGTFNGQGYTIKGIYSVVSNHDTGIFGSTVSAKDSNDNVLTTTITNLDIRNSYVNLSAWRCAALIGVGYSNAGAKIVISNVDNGMIVDAASSGDRCYGAFVGNVRDNASVTISNSIFSGSITGASTKHSGFVGNSNIAVTLTNCAFLGNTDANGAYFYGGTTTPQYTDCYYVSDSDLADYNAPAGVTKVGTKIGSDIVLSDAADVMGFANLLSKGFEDFAGLTVKLGANVDLNPGWIAPAGVVETWNGSTATNHWPLILNGTGFAGTFDGQNHTISGLHYANYAAGSTGNNYGIFGRLPVGATATIKNVTFENSYALFRSWQSTGLYGSVSGTLTLENVNNGINMNSYTDGSDFLAGMVGVVNSGATVNIINSNVSGTLSQVSTGGAHAGGFIGSTQGTVNITNSVFSGMISTNDTDKYVAGVIGSVDAGTVDIDNTVVTGTIKTQNNAAGFIGYVTAGTVLSIDNSAMYGSVSTTATLENGVYRVAGLIHDNRGATTLNNCIIAGNIQKGLNSSGNDATAYLFHNGQNVTATNVLYTLTDEVTGNSAAANNGTYVATIEGTAAQAILTEKGMTGWVATTTGYPMPKTLVKASTPTPDADALTNYVGYQTTKVENGTFGLRLVGNLDADTVLADYTNVGFKVTAFFGDKAVANECEITTVYSEITADFGKSSFSQAGKYVFVQECANLPTTLGDITFEVTTFATPTEGEVVLGATYRFVVDVDALS